MTTGETGFAYNKTRQAYLARNLRFARSHWSRLRGLMFTNAESFPAGNGLWISPSHGIHTFAMRFPIDAVYLDREKCVVHLAPSLPAWRIARVLAKATSVLELPAGTLRDTGTNLGDEIEIRAGEPAVSA